MAAPARKPVQSKSGGFRHVSEYIPDYLKKREDLKRAHRYAKQVRGARGQSRFHRIKTCILNMLEGLK